MTLPIRVKAIGGAASGPAEIIPPMRQHCGVQTQIKLGKHVEILLGQARGLTKPGRYNGLELVNHDGVGLGHVTFAKACVEKRLGQLGSLVVEAVEIILQQRVPCLRVQSRQAHGAARVGHVPLIDIAEAVKDDRLGPSGKVRPLVQHVTPRPLFTTLR